MSRDESGIDGLRIDRTGADDERSPAGTILVALALLALAAGGAYWFRVGRIPKVRTVIARERSASPGGRRTVLNASGYVVARRQATVSSKITGKVIEILVEEGMKVEKDQVLARLDDSNVQASLRLAEAEIAAARSALDETRVRLEEAEKELQRVRQLAAREFASASDLDRAEAAARSLKARLTQQESQAVVAEKQVAIWGQQAEDTVIRAPFTGIAVSKNAQPGEMISPVSAGGGFTRTGIGTIVDMDSLEIEVDVNESYLNRVTAGQPVEATLDAYPDWKMPCRVLAIIPTADRQKSTVKVRVKFDRLDPRVLPDMGVKVAFQGGGEETAAAPAVVIPEAAVRKESGRSVARVVEGGRMQIRALVVDHTSAGEVAVTGGLKAGEKVIVEGPAGLAEGSRVREARP